MIEVHPGMDRAGAHLLKLVGEATQSRRLTQVTASGADALSSQLGAPNAVSQSASAAHKSSKGKASAATGEGPSRKGRLGGKDASVTGKRGKKSGLQQHASVSGKASDKAASSGIGRLLSKKGSAAPDSQPASALPGKRAAKRKALDEGPEDNVVEAPIVQKAVAADVDATTHGATAGAGAAKSAFYTMILFDEVDQLLDCDKGFLAALAILISDSKVSGKVLGVTYAALGLARCPLVAYFAHVSYGEMLCW